MEFYGLLSWERCSCARGAELLGETVLQQIAVDTQCVVEDPENIDRSVRLEHVGNPVVPMKKNADVAVWLLPVAVA